MNKVFCIGFNKTGTSSLHALFLNCGMQSIHEVQWPIFSRWPRGRDFYRAAQCYSDGEKSDFAQLDRWFPDAVFILNTRDERAWLRSRIKHVMRFNEPIVLQEIIRGMKYGDMAKEFFFDEEGAVIKWIIERRIYHRQARTYFADNPRFLDIDITVTPDWDRRVLELFERVGIRATPKDPEFHRHRNKREGDIIEDQDKLNAYYALIDRTLEKFGARDESSAVAL